MDLALVSPRLIRKPGAWKSQATELNLLQFAQQNRKRLRRLENVQQHVKIQQKQVEKAWNNESKRLENIRRRLERKKEMERQRKKTMTEKNMQQPSNKNTLALLETKREPREGKVVTQHEPKRPFKLFDNIEKKHTQQRCVHNIPILEEKIHADLGRGKRQFREQELERSKITKIAQKLLTEAKGDRVLPVKSRIIVNQQRKKAVAKSERGGIELRKLVEHAKNEDFPRLQWIKKQRSRISKKKRKEETFRTGRVSALSADLNAKPSNSRVQPAANFARAVVNSDTISKNVLGGGYDACDETVFQMGGTSASRVQAAIIFDRKYSSAVIPRDRNNTATSLSASFPALSNTRAEFRISVSPIVASKSRAWSTKESKMSATSADSLPVF